MRTLAPLAALFAVAACGDLERVDRARPGITPAQAETARAAYAKGGCAACHGTDQGGVPGAGPAIGGLTEHWTVDTLAAFLANPNASLADDARLREMATGYPLAMPGAANLSAAERDALAAWLLSR